MHIQLDYSPFEFKGDRDFNLADLPAKIEAQYEDKQDYRDLLEEFREEIDELQNVMYAHDRFGLLLVSQAMDAAGKDGTIRHVMSGVNPHGLEIYSFKKPSDLELDHDFMWRTTKCFPQRGRIGIFNRSYYEEVLVVRVHSEILTKYQRIPAQHKQELDQVWQGRFEDIRNLEKYAHRNGIHILKFFLNVSKDEQRDRFLARIDTPSKNWKFAEGDVKEREYWDKYMHCYEEAIRATAASCAPLYVIPADDKKNMRLLVSQIILDKLNSLEMHYPQVDKQRRAELKQYREILLRQ